MENCSGVPAVIYNFHTQSLISFEDNLHAKGDLPCVIYFDFETTAPTGNCFDPEQKTMFVVSYVMIVAFHPDLKLDKIIIQRSYVHAIEQLTSLEYFSQDQIKCINKDLAIQLKDIAFEVSKRKCKKTMGQMFCAECALVKKTLLEWFNRKPKSQYLQISPFDKFRYERNDKCVICKFPLKVELTNYQTPDDEMTFGNCMVRYEHRFLRNIYTKEQINYSSDIKALQSYYETFKKFIHISIGLISMLNYYNKNDTVNYEVQEFIQDILNDDSIDDIKNHIMKTEIKNALSTSYKKVPKFNLKVYAFVYDELVYFPKSDIQYETFTENLKHIYHTLKMRHLGNLNHSYNIQDVILLSEIIENRFETMHKTYGFNPKKCSSASAMSGFTEREMSKMILVLPTKLDHVEIFEKTVTGGFSSVNTRLAFDTQILLSNLTKLKPNLDFENNPISKDFNYKTVYNLKLGKNKTQKKRVISKILSLDENNQYGNGMTKPLPTGCIKHDSDISWATFNFLMKTVDFKDTIGHLYIVDIEFDYENATEKMMVYNEIYPPIIEKHKVIDLCERSVFQLLQQYKE